MMESCPRCNPIMDNAHMLCTWVLGSKVFACDGSDAMIDDSFLMLFPKLKPRNGSAVVILFRSELCSHFWFSITEFHKGTTSRIYVELTIDETIKCGLSRRFEIREMWRE